MLHMLHAEDLQWHNKNILHEGWRSMACGPHFIILCKKVLLEHSHAHICMHYLWLLSDYSAEFSFNRDNMALKA